MKTMLSNQKIDLPPFCSELTSHTNEGEFFCFVACISKSKIGGVYVRKTKYVYVGVDLHKEQHTAVIMDCFNEKLGEVTFQNKSFEFGKLITKCKKYCTDGKGIVFALENSYGYGRALCYEQRKKLPCLYFRLWK